MTMIPWDQIIQNSAGSFDPVPTADYDMFVESAEPAQASTGNPMIRTKLRIVGGPHDGRRIWNNFVIALDNPNSLSFFFQHMAIFGMNSAYMVSLPPLNPELGADDPSLKQIAANMVQRPLRARVGQQSYNGQPRNNIERVMPPGPAMATPAAPATPAGYPSATPAPYPQAPAPAPAPSPYQQPDPWAQQPAAPQYPYPQAPAPQYPQPAPQYPQQPSYPQPAPYAQPAAPAAPPQYPQAPPQASAPQYPQAPAPQAPQYPQPPQAPPQGYPAAAPQEPAAAQPPAYPQPGQQPPAF